MRVRYKKTGAETSSSRFNLNALNEVLTGDDSPSISELDVFIVALGEWKDMRAAFKDKDLITDNYNTCFFEPRSAEERQRGYAE